MIREGFLPMLLVMAGTTYLTRMIPLVLFKKKITNKYLLSFLHYIPYTVLSAMTVPAIFYASDLEPAICGFIVALIFSFFEKGLVQVATFSCIGVLVCELLMKYVI